MAYSTTEQSYIDNIRTWVEDTVDRNFLEKIQESSDSYIYQSMLDAVDEANNAVLPHIETSWTIDDFPSYSALKYGTLKQVLIGHGIWSARNAVSYNDTGGVQIQAYDKWKNYLNWFNLIEKSWVDRVTGLKKKQNISDCYGSVSSEYYDASW